MLFSIPLVWRCSSSFLLLAQPSLKNVLHCFHLPPRQYSSHPDSHSVPMFQSHTHYLCSVLLISGFTNGNIISCTCKVRKSASICNGWNMSERPLKKYKDYFYVKVSYPVMDKEVSLALHT